MEQNQLQRTKDQTRLRLAVSIVSKYKQITGMLGHSTRRIKTQAQTDVGAILYELVTLDKARRLADLWSGALTDLRAGKLNEQSLEWRLVELRKRQLSPGAAKYIADMNGHEKPGETMGKFWGGIGGGKKIK